MKKLTELYEAKSGPKRGPRPQPDARVGQSFETSFVAQARRTKGSNTTISGGIITIPAAVARAFGITTNARVVITVEQDGVRIKFPNKIGTTSQAGVDFDDIGLAGDPQYDVDGIGLPGDDGR